MKEIIFRSAVGVFTLGCVALCLNNPAIAASDTPRTPSTKVSAKPAEGQLPLEDLRTFARVMEQVRASYIEPVDDKTLLENAIRGMLGELDPHSAYLDEKDFRDLQDTTSGEFGGLGIEVGMEDGLVKIIAPIDDTPASRAGIQSGDIIVKLDNQSVRGMSLDDAVGLMRGKAGEPLKMTILRQNIEQPIDLTLVREVIKARSVRQKTLEPGYGYIRIAQFQINTADEVKKAVESLKKSGVNKGLVIDMRNNPGGLLESAVEVSDAFLGKGLIVYTKGRAANSNMRYSAEAGDILNGVPIVVVVNDGTASAAEIVAGALQDNQRAILLGTQTFGKGSVQTVMPISETKAIKLTTALYYTPNGRSIQAEGIKPDIIDEQATVTQIQPGTRAAESDLKKHLGNGNSNTPADEQASKPATDDESWKQNDNQLRDALNALKAMSLGKKTP